MDWGGGCHRGSAARAVPGGVTSAKMKDKKDKKSKKKDKKNRKDKKDKSHKKRKRNDTEDRLIDEAKIAGSTGNEPLFEFQKKKLATELVQAEHIQTAAQSSIDERSEEPKEQKKVLVPMTKVEDA